MLSISGILGDSMQNAELIRRSADMTDGRRPQSPAEVKEIRAAAVAKGVSKTLIGETYAPETKYAVYTPIGTGLEYCDELLLEDGRRLKITSQRAQRAPRGSELAVEKYTAEEIGR